MSGSRFPTLFISTVAALGPWVDDMRPLFALSRIQPAATAADIAGRPLAVLVISGHWKRHGSALPPPSIRQRCTTITAFRAHLPDSISGARLAATGTACQRLARPGRHRLRQRRAAQL